MAKKAHRSSLPRRRPRNSNRHPHLRQISQSLLRLHGPAALAENGLRRPSARKSHAVPTIGHGSSAREIDHVRMVGGKAAALGGAAGRSGAIRARDANGLCLHPDIPGRCLRFFRRECAGSNGCRTKYSDINFFVMGSQLYANMGHGWDVLDSSYMIHNLAEVNFLRV